MIILFCLSWLFAQFLNFSLLSIIFKEISNFFSSFPKFYSLASIQNLLLFNDFLFSSVIKQLPGNWILMIIAKQKKICLSESVESDFTIGLTDGNLVVIGVLSGNIVFIKLFGSLTRIRKLSTDSSFVTVIVILIRNHEQPNSLSRILDFWLVSHDDDWWLWCQREFLILAEFQFLNPVVKLQKLVQEA